MSELVPGGVACPRCYLEGGDPVKRPEPGEWMCKNCGKRWHVPEWKDLGGGLRIDTAHPEYLRFEQAEAPPDNALSVLRDLVALEDTPLDKLRVGRVNDAWARARALVAEHPTDEETT